MRKKSLKYGICLCLVVSFFMANTNSITAFADFDSEDQSTIYSIQSRLKELGYFNYKATATFGEMTKTYLNSFRVKNSLESSNLIDEDTYNTLFSSEAARKDILPSVKLPIGPQTSTATVQGGSATSFSEVTNSFNIGDTITIQDFITGKSITVKRTGGENHVIAELSGSSTVSDLKEIFGNTFTWEKRSAVAIIGDNRIAAAMSVFEDGSDISIIIYFTDSASDISGILDVEYAEKILLATE